MQQVKERREPRKKRSKEWNGWDGSVNKAIEDTYALINEAKGRMNEQLIKAVCVHGYV